MSGYAHKLTEAWIVSDYYIEINGCELRETDILDFECMFGCNTVRAVLTFQDSQGIMAGEPTNSKSLGLGGVVNVGFTAAAGCGGEYEELFSIENVSSAVDKTNKRVVILHLIDLESRNQQGTFVSKGFSKKKYSDIVKEHYTNNQAVTDNPRKLSVIGHIEEIKQNLTIPSNMNFKDWLNVSLPLNGYSHIKDKYSEYIVSNQTTEFDKLKSSKEEFEVDAETEFSFWRILQYNLNGFDVSSIMSSIPEAVSNKASLNTDGTAEETLAISSKIKNKETVQKGGVAGTDQSKMIKSRGTKQSTVSSGELQQYFTAVSGAQTCSIWVPGLNKNRIGFRVIVNFPRPQYLQQDIYDSTFSGEWEVYAVRDKIIKQFFVQELFLRRPGGK